MMPVARVLTYGDRTPLQSLKVGDSFSYGGLVYQIVDETKEQPFYMVQQIGRTAHDNGETQFVKFGHRSPTVFPKSRVVRTVELQ